MVLFPELCGTAERTVWYPDEISQPQLQPAQSCHFSRTPTQTPHEAMLKRSNCGSPRGKATQPVSAHYACSAEDLGSRQCFASEHHQLTMNTSSISLNRLPI